MCIKFYTPIIAIILCTVYRVSSLDGSANIETPPTASIQDHRNLRLLPTTCGPDQRYTRIINGNKADINEYPWMALLSYKRGDDLSFNCGGTVINNRYILTAGHCLTESLFGVRVGEHNIRNKTDCEILSKNDEICADPVQDFFIEKMIVHSNFSQQHRTNDIGLIRLAAPINFSHSANAICLPITKEKASVSSGTKFILSGWVTVGNSTPSDDLLENDVELIALQDCQEKYSKFKYTITENQLCGLRKHGSDFCQSGIPIQSLKIIDGIPYYVQSGIASTGPRLCATTDIPEVYTRIDKYLNWILDNMTD